MFIFRLCFAKKNCSGPIHWLFSNRVLYTRIRPQRFKHRRIFVFSAYGRKSKLPALRVVDDSNQYFDAGQDCITEIDVAVLVSDLSRIRHSSEERGNNDESKEKTNSTIDICITDNFYLIGGNG